MARLQLVPRIRRDGSGTAPTRLLPEIGGATTNAFSAGRFVLLNSSGQVIPVNTGTETVYSSGAITTSTITSNLVGMAMSSSTLVANNLVPVTLAFPDVEFALPVLHATAASALPTADMVGNTYELVQYTVNGAVVLGVAKDRTSSPVFEVTEVPAASVNDINGIVWGKIIPAEREPLNN